MALTPSTGAAQSALSPSPYSELLTARHADHAELHGHGPHTPRIELLALTTIHHLDRDVIALRDAARLALTIGVAAPYDDDDRAAWLRRSEEYARTAHRLAPADADATFLLAAAMGLRARHEPLAERIRLGDLVFRHSETILAADPAHPGGLHLRGQLNAEAMRLSPVARFFARRVLGSDMAADASWEVAEASFRGAAAADPDNLAHRLGLAGVLRDTGRVGEARQELEAVVRSVQSGPMAEHHRREARAAIERLGAPRS